MRLKFSLRPYALLLASLVAIELLLRLPLGNASIDKLYSYSLNDGRCVGLKPNASTEYTGWLFRIPRVEQRVNAAGYRGSNRPARKSPDALRVLLLGDSYTFGVGMPNEHTIAARLEEVLAGSSSRPVEVLNFGVPGLNAEEVLAQYELFASQWEHDLVLYLLFNNDLDPPLCDETSVSRWEVASMLRGVYLVRVVITPVILGLGLVPGEAEVSRLTSVVDRFKAASTTNHAEFRIVILGNPLAGKLSAERFESWVRDAATPVLDLSHLWLDRTNLIEREYHFNRRGSLAAAVAIEDWIKAGAP